MPLETADDLDVFFDPEEFGESAVYDDGAVRLSVVVIRDQGDHTAASSRGRFVMPTNHLLLRADKVKPVSKARIDLVDADGNVVQSFIIQSDPRRDEILGSMWLCPAIPA